MKYENWLNTWLEDYASSTTKERTFKRYEINARLHIAPGIGKYELDEITPAILQKFVNALAKKSTEENEKRLSANSVNSIITVIKNSLKTAYTQGFCKTDASKRLVRPRREEKRVECFSVSEQKILERAVAESKKDKLLGVTVCLYTGLRIGELLALSPDDVDLERMTLHVSKSCHDTAEGKKIDTPKTKNSARVIPLPKELAPIIRKLKKTSDGKFLITDNGKSVSVRSYQRSFELLLKKSGLPHRGFHSLRHTFATRAMECGMDAKTLSEILGHKNASVTLNRYAHSFFEHKTAMMNHLAKNFFPVH